MAGIGEAASVTAFVSLAIQLFEGCVEGYKLCETARHMTRDGPVINSRFAFERMRLEQWAKKMGLRSRGPHDSHPDWFTIKELLEHQYNLVNEAAQLCNKYDPNGQRTPGGLSLTQGPTTSNTGDSSEDLSITEVASTLRQRILHVRPDMIRRAMTWAAIDKDKLVKLLKEIGDRNLLLYEYLADKQREEIILRLDAIDRTMFYQSTNVTELDTTLQMVNTSDSSLLAAAGLKRMRLTLEVDKREDETVPAMLSDQMQNRRYRAAKLPIDWRNKSHGTQVAPYNDSVVVVEWRTIDAPWANIEEPLNKLAKLLSTARNVAFHSLPCTGIVQVPELGRFGFVFDVTSIAKTSSLPDVLPMATCSLKDVLSRVRFMALTERLRIAYAMSEAVMQLHTTGWLHKGICSGHVMFLSTANAQPGDVVRNDAYLVGYGYAREDTADAGFKTELPNESHSTDTYRHPNARSGPWKMPFRKRFDMYSLACLLVELAFWESLDDVFARYRQESERVTVTHQQRLGTEACTHETPSLFSLIADVNFREELAHHVGMSYIEAIELCLHTRRPTMDQITGTDDELDLTMLVEIEVLSKLKTGNGSIA